MQSSSVTKWSNSIDISSQFFISVYASNYESLVRHIINEENILFPFVLPFGMVSKSLIQCSLTSNKFPNVLNEIFLSPNTSAGLCPSSCISYIIILNTKMDWIKTFIESGNCLLCFFLILLASRVSHFILVLKTDIWTCELSAMASRPFWVCGVWMSHPQIEKPRDLQMDIGIPGEDKDVLERTGTLFLHAHQQETCSCQSCWLPFLTQKQILTKANIYEGHWNLNNLKPLEVLLQVCHSSNNLLLLLQPWLLLH